MRLRAKIGLVVIVLGSVFLWGRCSQRQAAQPSKLPAVLPSNDIEQIHVDPSTHRLTIITSGGTQTLTLPDRQSTIDVQKNGRIKVTVPQIGFERHLFVGLIGSNRARLSVGMDGWYFKKLDLGVGVADQIGNYAPVLFAKATYNIKGNLQLGLVYQSNGFVGGILAVRVF